MSSKNKKGEKPTEVKTTTLSVRVPIEVAEMVEHTCKKKGINKTQLLTEYIAKFSSQPKIIGESSSDLGEPTPIILNESNENIDFNSDFFNKPKQSLFPYQVHIKNLTDEKLYDVDLFNYEHEKQKKIAYSCPTGVEYNRFLRFLSALSEAKEKVSLLRFQVWCDYAKFRSKQLNCCLHTIYQEPNGCMQSVPLQVGNYLSSHQQQSDIIDIPMTDGNKIELFNQLQLRLSYLMPETEMIITIYPSTIIK